MPRIRGKRVLAAYPGAESFRQIEIKVGRVYLRKRTAGWINGITGEV